MQGKKFMESPFGSLNVAFPECKGKLAYVWEDEVLNEELYKPKSQFFIADALGGHLFFRTNSRAKAQQLCDYCFGKDKYTVKIVVRASVR